MCKAVLADEHTAIRQPVISEENCVLYRWCRVDNVDNGVLYRWCRVDNVENGVLYRWCRVDNVEWRAYKEEEKEEEATPLFDMSSMMAIYKQHMQISTLVW